MLAAAAMVTEISDRESDIFEKWAHLPAPGFHILTRANKDRSILEGGNLSKVLLQSAGTATVKLPSRLDRPARTAQFAAPTGAEPILWRLLTTHAVDDAAMAWQVVAWYRQRWMIEQFFRTLKQQGLQREDSQLETAGRLIKLTAIAARAACTIMQLVQARDGTSAQAASITFSPAEIETLHALMPEVEGKTALQKNRIRQIPWPGPPGSSPNSAAGTATQFPNRQAQ